MKSMIYLAINKIKQIKSLTQILADNKYTGKKKIIITKYLDLIFNK